MEWNGQKYPHRTYEWTNAIPKGSTVIVGHDRSPFEEVPTTLLSTSCPLESLNL